MNKLKLLFLIPLLLFASLLAVPAVPRAQALLTGNVCISPTSSTSCPSTVASFSGGSGTQVTVAVNIQGSEGLAGFDVSVKADSSVINGSSIDITGTVVESPVLFLACINGVAQPGSLSTTCSPTDGRGVVHVSVINFGGLVTASPTTGRLFSITYKILASAGDVSIAYQTGCTETSLAGTTVCILVGTGAGTPNPETAQFGVFSNLAGYSLGASPLALTVAPGSSKTSTITLTSLNGFAGSVALAASAPSVLTATIPSPVSLTAGGSATSTLTVAASGSTPAGNYNVTVTGTSGTLSQSALILVNVPVVDFSITGVPATLTVQPSKTGTSSIIVSSINGFAGTVLLSQTHTVSGNSTPVTNPPTITLSASSLTVSAGGSSSATLTIATTNTTTPAVYSITVTGTSGSLIHSTVVTVVIPAPDFSLTASLKLLTISAGSTGGRALTLTSLNGFAGTVTLAVSITPVVSSVTVSVSPSAVVLSSGGTASSTAAVKTTSTLSALGKYNVTVTATSIDGKISHNVMYPVKVVALAPILIKNEVHWIHHLSLSKNANTQTWTANVLNPNSGITLFVNVRIKMIPSTGISILIANSCTTPSGGCVPQTLLPGASMIITVTQTFGVDSIGLKFSFTASVQYGVTIDFLTILPILVAPDTHSGSFAVVA